MFQKKSILLVLLAACAQILVAQDLLDIKATHFCLYHGSQLPAELYQFETDEAIVSLKDDILHKAAVPQNFDFICANVPSVVAVVDGSKRYVLYSRRFFNEHPDAALQIAVLAHAIGHHVNEHALAGGRPNEAEEQEADEWAGYAMCLVGVPAVLAEKIPEQLALASGIPDTNRRADIMHGFSRAEASLKNAEHASFYEDNLNEVLKNFPKFPFPVPKPSAEADLDAYFGKCKTLADADKKLRLALNATGYYTRRYLYVPGGFALVTRMEQFNKDGSCKSETARWSEKVTRCEGFDPLCFLNSLITTEPAYFRVIVFVVTPQVLTSSPTAPGRDTATAWLDQGCNKLPAVIGDWTFQPGKTNATALVYEFKIRESDRKAVQSTPSTLQGLTHLTKAQIVKHLR